MSNDQRNANAPVGSETQRDLLARLYREIGISAVAAALSIGRPAPRQQRISAAKLLEKRADESAAA